MIGGGGGTNLHATECNWPSGPDYTQNHDDVTGSCKLILGQLGPGQARNKKHSSIGGKSIDYQREIFPASLCFMNERLNLWMKKGNFIQVERFQQNKKKDDEEGPINHE